MQCLRVVCGADAALAARDEYAEQLRAAQERMASEKPGAPESLTRDALTAMCAGDAARLAGLYEQARTQEQAAGVNKGLRQSDSILYLYNNSMLRDRESYLRAMEAAAKNTSSGELRTRITLAILNDEYYEINQLKGENRFNKFTRIFNRASSSLSRLALLQPQDAAQLLLDGVYSFRKARASTDRERRMIFLAREFLEKYPEAPEAAEVVQLQSQLEEKLTGDRAQREKTAGIIYLHRGQFVPAEFHLENAALISPQDAAIATLLQQARTGRTEAEEAGEASMAVSQAETRFSAAETTALAKCARALMAGKPEKLEEAGASSPAVSDSAMYAAAAWLERAGRHDDALAQLTATARDYPDTPGGRAAAALWQNLSYNLGKQYDDAAAEMLKLRQKYILTGNRQTDETGYMMGSAALQSAGQSVSGIPALFLTDILVRGVTEQFKTQIETDAVINAGARYIRRYPATLRAREVAAEVASLSAKSGHEQRSADYLEAAGNATPEQQAKLRENEARKYFDNAMSAADPADKKTFLTHVTSNFNDTKIARTARKELDKMPPTIGENSIVLAKKVLARDQTLAQLLGMPPELIDGSKANGEITNEGVAIRGDGSELSYKLAGKDDFEKRKVPPATRGAALARANELSGLTGFQTEGGQAMRRRIFPFAIEGGAGGSGVEIAPKLVPYKDNEKDNRYFK